jgi:sulfatase maturation enzyme AslB (radical SAM superfamily)
MPEKNAPKINSTNLAEVQETPKFSKVVLLLNQTCNLSCAYCFEYKQKLAISQETLTKIFAFIDRGNVPGCNSFILSGGEPLLSIDLFESIVAYAHSRNLQIKPLVTNGLLLSDRGICNQLNQLNFTLLVSFDGLAYQNNCARMPSEAIHNQVITSILENKNLVQTILMTIGEHNIYSFGGDIIKLLQMGLSVGFRLVIGRKATVLKRNDIFRQFKNQISILCAFLAENKQLLPNVRGLLAQKQQQCPEKKMREPFVYANTLVIDGHGDIFTNAMHAFSKDRRIYKVGSVKNKKLNLTKVIKQYELIKQELCPCYEQKNYCIDLCGYRSRNKVFDWNLLSKRNCRYYQTMERVVKKYKL